MLPSAVFFQCFSSEAATCFFRGRLSSDRRRCGVLALRGPIIIIICTGERHLPSLEGLSARLRCLCADYLIPMVRGSEFGVGGRVSEYLCSILGSTFWFRWELEPLVIAIQEEAVVDVADHRTPTTPCAPKTPALRYCPPQTSIIEIIDNNVIMACESRGLERILACARVRRRA
jgi:hypothetical protein